MRIKNEFLNEIKALYVDAKYLLFSYLITTIGTYINCKKGGNPKYECELFSLKYWIIPTDIDEAKQLQPLLIPSM